MAVDPQLQSPSQPEYRFRFSVFEGDPGFFHLKKLEVVWVSVARIRDYLRTKDRFYFNDIFGDTSNLRKRTKVTKFLFTEQRDGSPLHVWMPCMFVKGVFDKWEPHAQLVFKDGRHRFLVLHEDFGFEVLPVAVPGFQLDLFDCFSPNGTHEREQAT